MKKQYREWIAERLKHYRDLLDKTQLEFAQLLNIKEGTYAAYEQGSASPNIYMLKKVCEQHKITLDKFMEGCPEENNAVAE